MKLLTLFLTTFALVSCSISMNTPKVFKTSDPCARARTGRLGPASNLQGSDLHGQNLSGMSFSASCLRSVDLSSTDLSNATFSSANLQGANLQGANLSCTNFSNADLRGARGLSQAALNQAYGSAVKLPPGYYIRSYNKSACRPTYAAPAPAPAPAPTVNTNTNTNVNQQSQSQAQSTKTKTTVKNTTKNTSKSTTNTSVKSDNKNVIIINVPQQGQSGNNQQPQQHPHYPPGKPNYPHHKHMPTRPRHHKRPVRTRPLKPTKPAHSTAPAVAPPANTNQGNSNPCYDPANPRVNLCAQGDSGEKKVQAPKPQKVPHPTKQVAPAKNPYVKNVPKASVPKVEFSEEAKKHMSKEQLEQLKQAQQIDKNPYVKSK